MAPRRIRITIETIRRIALSGHDSSVTGYCPACGRTVPLLSLAQAAKIGRVSQRTLFGWIESGRVHFQETASGKLLVCLLSISAKGEDSQTP